MAIYGDLENFMTEITFENVAAQQEHVPTLREFRAAVDRLTNRKEAAIIKMIYLTASRCSEVCTKVTPWEKSHETTREYGKGLNCSIENYDLGEGKKEKLLLVNILVAKRLKKPKNEHDKPQLVSRTVALPISPVFEPWTSELLWFMKQQHEDHKKDPKWKYSQGLQLNMTRMTIQNIVKRNLKIFFPTVHPHSLRHCRVNHLITAYGFDPYQVCAYTGWSMRNTYAGMGIQVSSNLDVYGHLSWRNYVHKLTVPLSKVI